jgi:glycogen operon protein
MDVRDYKGDPIHDDTFLLLFNAHHEAVVFTLPGLEDVRWEWVLDTRDEEGFVKNAEVCAAGIDLSVEARSVCLLKLSVGSEEHARTDSWKKRHETHVETAEKPRKGKGEEKVREKRTPATRR